MAEQGNFPSDQNFVETFHVLVVVSEGSSTLAARSVRCPSPALHRGRRQSPAGGAGSSSPAGPPHLAPPSAASERSSCHLQRREKTWGEHPVCTGYHVNTITYRAVSTCRLIFYWNLNENPPSATTRTPGLVLTSLEETVHSVVWGGGGHCCCLKYWTVSWVVRAWAVFILSDWLCWCESLNWEQLSLSPLSFLSPCVIRVVRGLQALKTCHILPGCFWNERR